MCSPQIVANLWSVTDKDIDAFLRRLLDNWLPHARAGDVTRFMGDSRAVCRLPYLVGAAPVVYGLPLTLTRPSPSLLG